ncbi:hypothetical protein NPIL_152501 [Nephila pilipes]|uniref:Uncharacterized protein n=1 Tax=Nephila pilipes TaxID=299642 RepID=A0A8X6U1E9_NEPPI|nr:hypothetical protein NPIL_152501 [Nephila pilipes]
MTENIKTLSIVIIIGVLCTWIACFLEESKMCKCKCPGRNVDIPVDFITFEFECADTTETSSSCRDILSQRLNRLQNATDKKDGCECRYMCLYETLEYSILKWFIISFSIATMISAYLFYRLRELLTLDFALSLQ